MIKSHSIDYKIGDKVVYLIEVKTKDVCIIEEINNPYEGLYQYRLFNPKHYCEHIAWDYQIRHATEEEQELGYKT